MAVRTGRFLWPGVIAPSAGTYTISHGIAPGVAILECLPQEDLPAEVGDLIITDDVTTIKIPDCKLDKLRQVQKGEGFVWVLEILDWRWKWTDTGEIQGWYNQLDQHGKLLPFSIRSPTELAQLCFEKMGITKYIIDLPPGLSKSDGTQLDTLHAPWLSVIPTTGTNPAVDWQGSQPAVELSNLANKYGRHVIPRLSDYTMMIKPIGINGGPLPSGSIANYSPTLDSPETPSGVAVLGDYTRIQMRLKLEAVMPDWNGRYMPMKDVSYAPRVDHRRQINHVQIIQPVYVDTTFTITIGYDDPTTGIETSGEFTYTVASGNTAADVATAIAGLINADSVLQDILTATTDAGKVIVTGINAGTFFSISATTDDDRSKIETTTFQTGKNRDKPWRDIDIDECWGAQLETNGTPFTNDRLTYLQAVNLAKDHVFRDYRVADVDVSGEGKINVPWFGEIERRQQLILTDHQVEQIQPERADQTRLDQRQQPFLYNLYNSYSRDKPAVVYGRIATKFIQPNWPAVTGDNTPANGQIMVQFSVDNDHMLVRFAGPVAVWKHGGWEEPEKLILQCAVMVRDTDTNAIKRYEKFELIDQAKGITKCVVRRHPDVQQNIIGEYQGLSADDAPSTEPLSETLTGFRNLEEDPDNRANYYLRGMKAQYFPTSAETAHYNGFMAVDLDGAIHQVTWEFPVREGGCGTVVSKNTEHEVNVPPYPARRRAENLTVPAIENATNDRQRDNNGMSNITDSMWDRNTAGPEWVG